MRIPGWFDLYQHLTGLRYLPERRMSRSARQAANFSPISTNSLQTIVEADFITG
jgi:hypothetical protein